MYHFSQLGVNQLVLEGDVVKTVSNLYWGFHLIQNHPDWERVEENQLFAQAQE